MGKGSESTQLASESKSDCNDSKLFTWNQVKNHNKKEDLWIVIKNSVYDVTNFHKKHPGGSKILQSHGGDDATVHFLSKIFADDFMPIFDFDFRSLLSHFTQMKSLSKSI